MAWLKRLEGSLLAVAWVGGTLTMSDVFAFALGFAFAISPSSDRALLALLCTLSLGSVFAFAFGLPLSGCSVDAPGSAFAFAFGLPLTGLYVVGAGSRTNRPLASLFGSFFTEPDGASPCGGSSAGRSSGRSMELSGTNEGSRD